jgi:DNA-binding MarR family transcriptional regulator
MPTRTNSATEVNHMAEEPHMRTRDYLGLLAERINGSADPADRAGVEFVTNITRLSARLVQDFEQVHRESGISWAGFRLLAALWVLGDAEPTQIAHITGATKAAVSSAINTLERDGFVARHHDATDRRSVRITLTKQGHALMSNAGKRQRERERAWTAILTDRELVTLLRILTKLVTHPTP